MGLIFSRFYEKPSTRATLEKIEQQLQNIEERRWDMIKRAQFITQILSFVPIVILIVDVCIFLFPTEKSWRDKFVVALPLALLSLILFVCKKIVQWYSRWSLDNEETRLRKLQKEKRKILEIVCETESYRVATELLEKYDPKQLRRRERPSDRPSSPVDSDPFTKQIASPTRSPQVRQRQPPQTQLKQMPRAVPSSMLNQSISFPIQAPVVPIQKPSQPTPMSKPQVIQQPRISNLNNAHNNSLNTSNVATSSVRGRPVRPILSKERSIFEKVVDWVVADGPDNRFALICRYCFGHNGMSLAEEFETINFVCCYCYNLNTSANRRTQSQDKVQQEKNTSEEEKDKVDDTKIGDDDTTIKDQGKTDAKSKEIEASNNNSEPQKPEVLKKKSTQMSFDKFQAQANSKLSSTILEESPDQNGSKVSEKEDDKDVEQNGHGEDDRTIEKDET